MENFGQGQSLELDQAEAWKKVTGWLPEQMSISSEEREILRPLAEKVARLADADVEKEKIELWRRNNQLEKGRPLVFCYPERGWNEVLTDAEHKCTGALAIRFETELRKKIFWAEEMGDDTPLEPYFDIPYTVSADDWGLKTEFHKAEEKGSMTWEHPLKDYQTDLGKLHSPEYIIDMQTTTRSVELAKEAFGDILPVRLRGRWWPSLGITKPAIHMRGLSNFLFDFYDHPDELKQFLSIISNGLLEKMDYIEQNNLLHLNNDSTYNGSGGFGFTNELPQEDAGNQVRLVDTWGFTESQETVGISPDMYEEFIFPVEKPIMERFGLTAYGCCEGLDKRWHVVKNHHKLRRVSCSPWADWAKMAEYLEDNYILSMKPNPACLASYDIDEDAIRTEIREAFEITRGCVVEIIMKDNHTIGKNPGNIVRWCQIAQEEAAKYQ